MTAVRRRSCLTVPGGSDKMIGKAATLEADEIVLDLEDAVPPAGKADARRRVVAALAGGAMDGRRVAVRINGASTPWYADDLAALASIIRANMSIVVPKVQSPDILRDVEVRLAGVRTGLQALIETAAGLAHCVAIAGATPRLETLILGYGDLASSLGRDPDLDWSYVQETVLVAARANDIEAIDGPCFDLTEGSTRLTEDCARAARLGFAGKWAIHPSQVASIDAAFTPDPELVARARRVLKALDAARRSGVGVAVFDGSMIDEAMRLGAERTLTRAGLQ